MADTTTQAQPRVKEYYDYAQQQVDEQAILDKYNAATIAQYNVQREQNRQAENQFYNQMYNTQKTAMDTIRQANASAVASGASRGVQAANELSALLGLQQESVASATELAQANRQTAQEETAAVLENVLNAYQQAAQERSQLVTQAIEADSLTAQEATASQQSRDSLQKAAQTGFDAYMAEVAGQGKNYQGDYSLEGANSLNQALGSLTAKGENQSNDGIYFTDDDFVNSGTNTGAIDKTATLKQNLETIQNTYGLDLSQDKAYNSLLSALDQVVNLKSAWTDTGWGQFMQFLTLGMAGQIETLVTGSEVTPSDITPILGDLAEMISGTTKNRSKDNLRKTAQEIYSNIKKYITTQYRNKQTNNIQQ